MTELGQHRIFPDFKRQRARMVKLLEEQGIADEAVLAAMRTVRRHLFVPEALQGRAYEDHALPIGFGQTISQPYIVAFMSQLLEAKPGMKVLEIGTGSGYQDQPNALILLCLVKKASHMKGALGQERFPQAYSQGVPHQQWKIPQRVPCKKIVPARRA